MRFIPEFTFNIQTPHSKNTILRRLQEITHSETKIPNMKSRHFKEPFYGQVSPNGFIISPCMRFLQGSFVPVIHGKVYKEEQGANVNITTKLIDAVLTLWIVWLSLTGLFFIIVMSLLILGQTPFSFGSLVPLILFCFGYVLGHLGLRHEALIYRNYLDSLWSYP